MPRAPTVPFHFRIAPVAIGVMGLSPSEATALVQRCGLPLRALEGPCTTTLDAVRKFMMAGQSRRGGTFGIDVARAVPEGTFEEAELFVRTARNLGEGLIGLARFASLINAAGRFEYVERGELVELHYSVAGQRDCVGEPHNLFTIAYVVRALRTFGLPETSLRRVWFAHRTAPPPDVQRFFGCRIELGAPTCGFSLPAADARRPLRTSDPVTHGFMRRQADAKLAALGTGTVAAMVAGALANEISFSGVGLARIARRIGMSTRTVQRRLEAEGTSFRDVLDHVRQREASRLLTAGAAHSHVATLLGFSDARALRRAVARWSR